MRKLEHKHNGSNVVSSFDGIQFVHPSDCETVEDANWSFSDGEIPLRITTDGEFLGVCFHIIQQVGGHVQYNGNIVSAYAFWQTSGSPLEPNDEILLNGDITLLKDLRRK